MGFFWIVLGEFFSSSLFFGCLVVCVLVFVCFRGVLVCCRGMLCGLLGLWWWFLLGVVATFCCIFLRLGGRCMVGFFAVRCLSGRM